MGIDEQILIKAETLGTPLCERNILIIRKEIIL